MALDSKPTEVPFVKVEWEDIVFDDDWDEGGSSVHTKEITSWGFLLIDEPTYLVIGATYNWADEEWATKHAIPKTRPVVTEVKFGESS